MIKKIHLNKTMIKYYMVKNDVKAKDVARYMNISRQHLYKLITNGFQEHQVILLCEFLKVDKNKLT